MNIAWIEPHMRLVGGIRRIIEVSNRLVKFGHRVTIFTPEGKPCRWLKSKSIHKPLAKLTKEKFDVITFNLAEQYSWALKAKASVRAFWVLAPEAYYKDPTLPIQALQRNEFAFMVNSLFMREYILAHRRVKYTIPIIPGGINPNQFKYDPAIPKEYHVAYYGSPRPWKGTKLIENALGGSKLKLLKMHGFNAPQKDMYRLYGQATCFVSACKAEGFNYMPLEAMSCGCPTVMTDDGGSRDYVEHTKNAIIVPRSIEGIKQGVHLLLSNKNLRRTLIKSGLRTARDVRFDWDNVTKKLEKTFESFLDGSYKNK